MDGVFSQFSRPIPPTPRAMAHQRREVVSGVSSDPFSDFQGLHLSATSIPRPISGTSRRASSLFSTSAETAYTTQDRLQSPRHVQPRFRYSHNAFADIDGMPPASYPHPKAMLPRSDSIIPFRERSKTDLSGVREQLHIRDFSRSNLDALGSATASSAGAQSLLMTGPETSKNLLSPIKEITQKSLIRPINPPIPRSQSNGYLACFNGVQNDSPAKPSRRVHVRQAMHEDNESQIDVMDALLESRMTKHEIEILDQVQIEKAANKERMYRGSASRSSCAGQHKDTIIGNAGDKRTQDTPCIINLSANDAKNIRRIQEQQQKRPHARSLFINTKLANPLPTHSLPSCPAPQPTDARHMQLPPESLSNPQDVYRPEPSAFWTGRFLTLSDRLRQSDCNELLKPETPNQGPLKVNSSAFEEEYDKLEATRTKRVLKELRKYCKNSSATKSFDLFEKQMVVQQTARASQLRPGLRGPPSRFAKPPTGFEPKPLADLRQLSSNAAHSQVVRVNAQGTMSNVQGTMSRLSGLVSRRGGLIKSKTTGDLTSLPMAISDTRARAVREREERPPVSYKPRETATKMGNHISGGNELVYVKRRGDEQSGGELVRRVVDAGIREVRKISRRVGSMGWSSNDDRSNETVSIDSTSAWEQLS